MRDGEGGGGGIRSGRDTRVVAPAAANFAVALVVEPARRGVLATSVEVAEVEEAMLSLRIALSPRSSAR
eukprot:SAG11_NODE_680_length_7781_cov_6.490497_3_plen_69_part_00